MKNKINNLKEKYGLKIESDITMLDKKEDVKNNNENSGLLSIK